MDISKLNLFSMMQANLSYLNERQNMLAQNIANANVPGYSGKDIKQPNFSSVMSQTGSASNVKLATTEPGHISAASGSGNFSVVNTKGKSGEITPSGNNVIIEDEVLKMSKNSLEYQQTTELYMKTIGMIKTAIGSA